MAKIYLKKVKAIKRRSCRTCYFFDLSAKDDCTASDDLFNICYENDLIYILVSPPKIKQIKDLPKPYDKKIT